MSNLTQNRSFRTFFLASLLASTEEILLLTGVAEFERVFLPWTEAGDGGVAFGSAAQW